MLPYAYAVYRKIEKVTDMGENKLKNEKNI